MITFLEYMDIMEKNYNNHGGDRSSGRSQIKRMTPKYVSPYSPKRKKRKLFKF